MIEHTREQVPKASSPRRPRAAARDKLLEAGAQLFGERGLEAVNSNVIARAARVGVGTFYANFTDKQALHRAVVVAGIDALQEALGRAVRASTGEPLEVQVRAMVTAAVLFADEQPLLFRVAFGPAAAGTAGSRPSVGFSPRGIERRLAELRDAGELESGIDPGLSARGYLGMQSAILLAWLDAPERVGREVVVETLTRLHPAIAAQTR
jgi:AcrR family transcriptional regulator